MDNKSTTKRMIGAVVLVLIAALLLAWLLKGKNKSVQEQQELIADQTQEASPILGFPGVNEDDKNADGTVAAGDGSATEDGSYVIGAADQATDNAQQQAQNALAAGGDAAASAGQSAADGAGQVAAVAAGAAAGAATAASQTGQQVADNATGFQVRDPQSQDGGDGSAEQRPIVENGEVKAGTGSMGGSEVAAGTQDQQSGGSGDATQSAAATGGAAATQSSGSGDSSSGSGSGSAAQQTASAGAGSGSNSGGSSSAAKPAKKAANPKLVNEKPVPAPRTQSASAGNRSSGSSASRSSSASSRSSSASAGGSSAAAGGSGYAIQVLAASSRSKAEAVRKDIARDGYPAFVVRAKVNGKTVYRVRVGTYPGKGAARTVQGKMKARYTKNQYVQNSFVTKN